MTVLCLSLAGTPARPQVPGTPQHYPTAHCQDGTYYYGPKGRKLTCAHHRGVSEWLAPPPGAVRHRKRACVGHRGVARWLARR